MAPRTGRSILGWRGGSELIAAALALSLGVGGAAMAGPPERVVSINLCTDQFALLLAAPGQLVSVTHVAADPRVSAMAAAAEGLQLNRAHAEEVHALAPDLVLAGPWTSGYTVALLRRLGIAVAVIPDVRGLDDVPEALRATGAALGRDAAATAMADTYAADLAALRTAADAGRQPRAAIHNPNNYTSGAGSMADQILTLAGLANVAAEVGIEGGGWLALESMVMLAPDLVISAEPYPGASRAEEVLRHPAAQALAGPGRRAALADSDWVCGTPHVLRAATRLRDATATAAP